MIDLNIDTPNKLIKSILNDLYKTGKEVASISFAKWQNKRNIEKLIRKIKNYEMIKTIWQREKFVRLKDFYYPLKLEDCSRESKYITAKSLVDIPDDRSFIIEGTIGQGKSIFLRYLCIQELNAVSSGRIPIFLELRKLSVEHKLQQEIYNVFENLGFEISDKLFTHYARSGKIVVLLDGFDELDEAVVLATIRQLENWVERYPKLQFIITSRPGSEIGKSRLFSVMKLRKLTHSDFEPFMHKIGVDEKCIRMLISAIKGSTHRISGLLQTPLLLTLLILVYQLDQEIPRELPDFFEKIFTTIFTRHDKTKPGFIRKQRSGLSERQLELFFSAFCFCILKNNFPVSLSQDAFSIAFSEARKYAMTQCNEEDFRFDLVKIACIMQEDGFHVAFIHKSILEYYSAAFVKQMPDSSSEKFYTNFLEHRETSILHRIWKQTLSFLSTIDSYRYFRYFYIPSVDLLLNQIGVIELKFENFDQEKILKLVFEYSEISITKNQSGKSAVNFIQFKQPTSMLLDKIRNSTIDVLFTLISDVDIGVAPFIDSNGCAMLRKSTESKSVNLSNLLQSMPNVKAQVMFMIQESLNEILEHYNYAKIYLKTQDAKYSSILEWD